MSEDLHTLKDDLGKLQARMLRVKGKAALADCAECAFDNLTEAIENIECAIDIELGVSP